MFENVLIAKVIASIVSVGAIGGVGYAFHRQIRDYLLSDYQDYVVKVTSEVVDFSNDYFCSSTDENKKDVVSCEIKKIDVDEKKISDLNKFKNNSSSIKKEEFKKDNFYKLRIDRNKFKDEIKLGKTTVEVKSYKKSDTEKKYATLKIFAELDKEGIKFSNEMIIAKNINTHTIDDSSTDLLCKIGPTSSQTDVACDVYAFSSDITDIKTLDFSSQFSKITKDTKDKIKENNLYVIDFSKETNEANKDKLTSENLKQTIVFKNGTADKKAEFTFIKPFIGKYESEIKTIVI